MMGAFFAASFLVNGVLLPFFPVFLVGRGLSGEDVAFILAAPQVGRLVSMPIVSHLADRVADRRLLVLATNGAMMALGLALWPLHDGWPLMVVATLLLVVNSVIAVLADTIALSLERRGLGDYGRMRLWGSLSFISGNLACGFALSHFGDSAVYATMIAGFAVALAATFLIPRLGPAPRRAHADALTVLRRPAFLGLLAAAALIQSGHGALYGFATLTWQARGFDPSLIGAFWATGVIAEIVLFGVAGRLFGARSPLTLLAASGLIGIVRWMLFAIDTGVLLTFVIQAMHAGTFALAHIAVMRLLRERVPEEKTASAQGTYVVLAGLTQAAALAVAGVVWARYGGAAFAAMTLFNLAGLAVLAWARPGAARLPTLHRGGSLPTGE